MVKIRCSASDRIRVPDVRRRTRRSASTIGGGTPDMTIGRADADRAGARPYLRRRVRPLRSNSLQAQAVEFSGDAEKLRWV